MGLIEARVAFVVWPFSRFGKVKSVPVAERIAGEAILPPADAYSAG